MDLGGIAVIAATLPFLILVWAVTIYAVVGLSKDLAKAFRK
jgi:hypothetical protein